MMDGYLLNKSIILGSQLYFSGYFSGNFIWFVLTLRRHPQIAGGWGVRNLQRLIVDIYASIEWNETMLFAFPLYCHCLHDGMSVYMPILQFVRQNWVKRPILSITRVWKLHPWNVDISSCIAWNNTKFFASPSYCRCLHDGIWIETPILQFTRQNGLNGQFYRLPGYENCTHESLITQLVLHEMRQFFFISFILPLPTRWYINLPANFIFICQN